jgi:hypothetical protein
MKTADFVVCCTFLLPFRLLTATGEPQALDHGANSTPVASFGTTVVIPSGLRGDIYFLHRGTTVLPEFERLKRKPAGTIWTTTLSVVPHHWRAGFPGVTRRFEWFGINYTGRFWIEKPGPYQFALLSDDGSKLWVDGRLVIDNDCQHPPDVRAAEVILSGGLHRIQVAYFQGPRDCIALVLAVAGPKEPWRIFNTDEFRPPSNPEDWKYPEGENITSEALTIDAPNLKGFVQELFRQAEPASGGCLFPPVHNCGK